MRLQLRKIFKRMSFPPNLRRIAVGLLSLVVLGCWLTIIPGLAKAALEEDVRSLRADMDQIKKDIGEIKTLLEGAVKRKKPEKTTGTVGFNGRPMLGESQAPVTIVEFSDYQCPFCRRYALNVFPTLKGEYIDTGKVRYVFRDFPLTSIHAQAQKAHESAHCAGEDDKYWEMHDALFQKQNDLTVPSLKQYAADLGLNSTRFNECLDSGKYQDEIQKEVAKGAAAGCVR